MKLVAKLLVIDPDDNYLLLTRSNHPTFPNDPDLPGGIIEAGEHPLQAAVRETQEEAGIVIDPTMVTMLQKSDTYNENFTYYLYSVKLDARPDIVISWEHKSYEWLDQATFLERASTAADSYMHMVHDVVA